MPKLVFVTQNLNKISDAQRLFPDIEIDHINFDVPEIQSLDTREIV
jgi:inosine/xanthosine triphosphate pyrophosphatase family protein